MMSNESIYHSYFFLLGKVNVVCIYSGSSCSNGGFRLKLMKALLTVPFSNNL